MTLDDLRLDPPGEGPAAEAARLSRRADQLRGAIRQCEGLIGSGVFPSVRNALRRQMARDRRRLVRVNLRIAGLEARVGLTPPIVEALLGPREPAGPEAEAPGPAGFRCNPKPGVRASSSRGYLAGDPPP